MADLTPETWQTIPLPGCENYRVSDLGRVRNFKAGKDLRLSRGTTAPFYLRVNLPIGTKRVHRLVAHAFLGPCPSGLEVRHLDGDSQNNAAVNLAYGTKTENAQDRVAHAKPMPPRRLDSHCAAGHEMTAANTRYRTERGRVRRVCRACQDIYRQRHREKALS